jgi:hypothetical protein
MDIGTGIVIFFGAIAAWMCFTTPRFREVVWGYALLLAIIGAIISLITGQGPGSDHTGGHIP